MPLPLAAEPVSARMSNEPNFTPVSNSDRTAAPLNAV